MRRAWGTIIAAVLGLAWTSSSPATQRVDFVIDIDETIVDFVSDARGVPPAEKVIEAAGQKFRLADGAAEFILSLSRIPGARISFFSAAGSARNIELLSKLQLPDGRTAFDLAEGRIFSSDHLDNSPAGQQQDSIFTAPLKKDLRKIPGIDLERAILIEDSPGYAMPGQEKNLLFLPRGFAEGAENIVPDLLAMQKEDPEFMHEMARDHLLLRNRLARARGLIEQALQISKNEGLSLVEALWRKQWHVRENGGLRVNIDIQQFRIGARALRDVGPSYHFTPILPKNAHTSCSAEIKALLRALNLAPR